MGNSGRTDLHEDFERADPAKPGSDRNFGLVMAGVFLVLGGLKLWHASAYWPIFLSISGLFAASALFVPERLAPLNWLWFRFGILLHKIVSPAVMAVVFFLVVTPVGLLMRVCGRRPLALRLDSATSSYWLARTEPTAPQGSMSRQF
jgi:hypothetical protein